MLLYLLFVILFGIHLNRWDYGIPGRCYNSRHLALPNAHHPYVDNIYLSITCLYMFSVLLLSLSLAISRYKVDPAWGKRHKRCSALVIALIKYCNIYTRLNDLPGNFTSMESWFGRLGLSSVFWYPLKIPIALTRANPILTIAMFQLPLHLYFIIRLRLTNEPLLANGSDEIQWGFGQIYTLIMSAGLVAECYKGYISSYICSVVYKYHNTNASGTGYLNAKLHVQDGAQEGAQNIARFEDKAGTLRASSVPEPQHPEIRFEP